MAYPTTSEFGAGASGGSIVAFTAQPDNWLPIPAPRRKTPFGAKKDGYDSVRLIWGDGKSGISFAEYAQLTAVLTAATAAGGAYYVRYWDWDADAYATKKCVPQPPQHQSVGYDRYLGVTMEFSYLGVP